MADNQQGAALLRRMVPLPGFAAVVMAISRVAVLFALCCVLTACTEEKVEGSKTIYSFALWVPVLVALLGVFITFLGIKRHVKTQKVSLVVIGVVVLVLGLPGYLMERLILDDQELDLRTGTWFSRTEHHIKWVDVKTVRIVPRRRADDLVFEKRNRESQTVRLQNTAYAALDKVIAIAKARNVAVIDERKF